MQITSILFDFALDMLRSRGGHSPSRFVYVPSCSSLTRFTFVEKYPSLSSLADIPAQAELILSTNTKPGNYTLGLGIDAGGVTVWSMVQVEVAPQGSTTPVATSTILGSVAAATLVLVLGLIAFGLRSRRQPPVQHDLT